MPCSSGFDDDDDFGAGGSGGFESELAAFESNGMDIDFAEAMGEGPENVQTSVKWSRVDPPELNPEDDTLQFQQIDIENYLGSPLPGMPGAQIGK